VGKRGAFEPSELVELLRRENMKDIVAVAVDPALSYVDVLIVATAKTPRHLVAVAEFVNKAYKRKTKQKEGLCLEGKGAQSGWIATDMGE